MTRKGNLFCRKHADTKSCVSEECELYIWVLEENPTYKTDKKISNCREDLVTLTLLVYGWASPWQSHLYGQLSTSIEFKVSFFSMEFSQLQTRFHQKTL